MKIKSTVAVLLAQALLAFLPVTVFPPAVAAQDSPHVENRVLLVFDTSSDMKKMLPAEVKGIKQLFALTFSSQLQRGDSIGVWTFGKELKTGACPLQRWDPYQVNTICSNILTAIEHEHYSKTTSFKDLMPALNRLMAASPQLTTFVFCDGNGEIFGTPVDKSINNIFKDNSGQMRHIRQPFVIVFRTQYGQFTASTINTAETINVPHFPTSPQPAPPPVVQEPPPPPAPTAPPLIIIGTTVRTNLPPPAPAPAPATPSAPIKSTAAPPVTISMPVTNEAPKAKVVEPTSSAPESNAVAPLAAEVAPTNMAAPLPATVSAPPTPPAAEAPETAGEGKGDWIALGAGIVVGAGAVIFFVARRSRRHASPSLITESLKKR